MIFLVFWGEPSPYVREHFHKPKATEPNLWMAWTVGVLAFLAVVGGWIQIGGLWHPLTTFLEPVAEPHVEPSGLQDLVTSLLAVALAVAGIYLAWAMYAAGKIRVPDYPSLQRVLERKFYWDEAYDLAFYRPAVWIANGFHRWVERPLIAGSIQGLTFGARFLSGRTGEVQTGLTRTYVLALGARRRGSRARLPGGARMNEWLTTTLIAFPVAAALFVWLLPWKNHVGRVARAARGARRSRNLDQRASRGSTSTAASSSSSGRNGSATSASRTTSGCTAGRSGSSGWRSS